MENYFMKLMAIAEREKLSEKDKAVWRSCVLCAGQDILRPILVAAEEKHGALLILTENMRRKIDIMRRRNASAWAALISEEEIF